MLITAERLNYTYNPSSPFSTQALKDVSLTIGEITPSPSETARQWKHYFCPESEPYADWTEEDMLTRFMVVTAQYEVEYDHTKTFLDDGTITQSFILIKEGEIWFVGGSYFPV